MRRSLPYKKQKNNNKSLRFNPDVRFVLPTFPRAEETVHLHTGTGVGHAEGGAGNQSLLRWAAVGGSDQAPTGTLARPFQQLHRLAWRESVVTSDNLISPVLGHNLH